MLSPQGVSVIATRHVSDDVLARRAGAGDDEAFALLFERHAGALYRYCRSIVSHDQDAQDAVQNTMVGALGALRRAPLEAPLRPWLFRIAHNESISLLRRRRPADDLDAQFDLAGAPMEAQLEDRERMNALVSDLRELPERQRSALVMRELSGLSHEEISVALAIPVSATKQAIFDARRGLQAAEEGRQMQCEPVQRAISDGDGRVLRARQMRAHVRGCPSCSAMRDAIATREKDLAALLPPLPALAASALLERVVEAGLVGGGAAATGLGIAGGGAGAGAVAGGAAAAAGKAGGIAGLALSGKALAVTAAVLTAAGTVTVVAEQQAPAPRTQSASASSPSTAGAGVLDPVAFGGSGAFSPTVGVGGATSGGTGGTGGAGTGGGAGGAAPTGVAGTVVPGVGGLPGVATPGTPGTPGVPAAGATPPAVPGTGSGGGNGGSSPGSGGSANGGSGGSGGSAHGGSGGSSSPPKGGASQGPSKVVENTKQTVGAVTQATGQTVTNVVSNTSQTVGAVTQGTGQAVNDVVSTAKQTVDTVVDTAKDTVGTVVDTTKGTVDKVVDTGTDLLSKLPIGKRPK